MGVHGDRLLGRQIVTLLANVRRDLARSLATIGDAAKLEGDPAAFIMRAVRGPHGLVPALDRTLEMLGSHADDPGKAGALASAAGEAGLSLEAMHDDLDDLRAAVAMLGALPMTTREECEKALADVAAAHSTRSPARDSLEAILADEAAALKLWS